MRQRSDTPRTRLHASVELSSRDEQIIGAINRYFYLTTEQVTRLFYSKGSHTSVYGILRSLAERGYTDQIPLPKMTKGGKERLVNTLDRKGRVHLAKLGREVPPRLRKSERPTSPLFYTHTLAVNDFLIAAELLVRSDPAIALPEMLHELTFKRSPLRVEDQSGKHIRVAPDGWLNFTVTDQQGIFQACVLLECDRDTEEQRAWRQKVQGLLLAADGAYQTRFQTQSLAIAVTTPSERRRLELIRWTEAELHERGAASTVSEAFHFTSQPADTTDPQALFLSPVWQRPFDKQSYPLLEVYLE